VRYIDPEKQKKQDDLDFYRKIKMSNECLCERGKQPGMWFCYKCHKSLPADMQRALWGAMGPEMFAAYDDAVKYLDC